jgi:hypothetical protein
MAPANNKNSLVLLLGLDKSVTDGFLFLFLISILFGSRGGNGLLYCGVQDQYYMETRTDDLFLFLFSFLFGSRGGNGRLLYSGVQDQYCIEIRR